MVDGESPSDMKVCVYAIALNEAHFAARLAASCREADMVLVADTGSTDDTVAALRAEGVVVESISVKPWRFDDARNAALALIPDDIDVCISAYLAARGASHPEDFVP